MWGLGPLYYSLVGITSNALGNRFQNLGTKSLESIPRLFEYFDDRITTGGVHQRADPKHGLILEFVLC